MKKIISVILTALLIMALLGGCNDAAIAGDPDDGDVKHRETTALPDIDETTSDIVDMTDAPDNTPSVSEVSVRPAAWNQVQWETYSCQYFTLQIPSGWKVDWTGDANQLQWSAYAPDSKVGFLNRDHIFGAKDANMAQALGFGFSLNEGTVQEFFETIYADTTEYFNVQNSCVPDNISVIQAVRPYDSIHDYKSLYATFKDANVEGEGIYSAAIMDSKDVIYNGANYGAWEINCIISEWAPLGRLVDWAPVLHQIGQSFTYTDQYIMEWQAIAQSALTPTSTANDTDPVMEAYEERSKSDTIIQEKRSDMLEERERVYDNDTGEIYRAYSGFLDDMGDQSRYTQITDDQYTEGYDGWIDKD